MSPKNFQQGCDHAGCDREGLYPAPKTDKVDRDFYWFCLEHIRQYNAQWNYFGGLSESEIEKEIRRATVWERPTWPFGKGPMPKKPRASSCPQKEVVSPLIRAALKDLDLTHPSTIKEIKSKYRELAKRFHPDANEGSKKDIEKFHRIQQAFATLQKFYAKKSKHTSDQ